MKPEQSEKLNRIIRDVEAEGGSAEEIREIVEAAIELAKKRRILESHIVPFHLGDTTNFSDTVTIMDEFGRQLMFITGKSSFEHSSTPIVIETKEGIGIGVVSFVFPIKPECKQPISLEVRTIDETGWDDALITKVMRMVDDKTNQA